MPDTIVTNLNEFGGIRRVVEFARACERFDVGFRFHSGETGIGSAAYLHLSAAIAARARAEPDAVPLVRRRRHRGGPVRAEGRRCVEVPTGPGLGVTLDPVALRALPRALPHRGAVPGRDRAGGYGESFRRR